MKIAIFGGSFDPPHIGHEYIAKQVVTKLNIDKLIIIPTYLNPFKKNTFLDIEQRVFLLHKLFKDKDKITIFNEKDSKEKSIYSINSVKHIKKVYKPSKIYFIIGTDNIENLHLWKDIEKLKNMVTFIEVTRNGFLNKDYDRMQTLNINIDVSSTQLRNNLNLNLIPKIIRKDIEKIWQKNRRKPTLKNRLKEIKQILEDKKAHNIEIINLQDKNYMVSSVIIATTLNSKHGFSLLTYLKEALKPKGEEFLRVEENDEWIIIDLGDILVHLMSQSHREKYNIEEFLNQLEKSEKSTIH